MNNRKFSQKQEKGIAKKLGGRVVTGSGSSIFQKGDIIFDDLLIEAKTKIEESKSHTIKKEWFEKIEQQAYEMGKFDYAVVFNFGEVGNNGEYKDYFIISDEYFKYLYKNSNLVNEIIDIIGGVSENITDDVIVRQIKKAIRSKF